LIFIKSALVSIAFFRVENREIKIEAGTKCLTLRRLLFAIYQIAISLASAVPQIVMARLDPRFCGDATQCAFARRLEEFARRLEEFARADARALGGPAKRGHDTFLFCSKLAP
jgi:hypothetical protein